MHGHKFQGLNVKINGCCEVSMNISRPSAEQFSMKYGNENENENDGNQVHSVSVHSQHVEQFYQICINANEQWMMELNGLKLNNHPHSLLHIATASYWLNVILRC